MNDRLSDDLASLRISRDAAPPPRRTTWWRWVVVAVAGAGVAGAVATWAVPYAGGRLFKAEVELTEVTLVSPAQASVDLTATGYVVPQVLAKVGAKVTGRIAQVNIREGGHAKIGDVLFLLDPSDQKSAVLSGEARTAAARAKAASGRAHADVARANLVETKQQWEREKKLAATGAATQASADDLGARVKALEEQVREADTTTKAADADAVAAKAEVAALDVSLGNMTVPSPIDGTAVTKPAELGDIVTPAVELVELVDFSSLLVEVDVPEARLGKIKKGSPCEVVLDAFPDKRRRGEVVEVSPRLNRAKASGTVKVKIVDGAEDVLPEMAARVSFLAKALDAKELAEPPKKVIPQNAVADRAGQKVAFVVDGGKLRAIPLTLGPAFGSGFEIVNGPTPGTHVVKDPAATLVDGQSVKEKGGE